VARALYRETRPSPTPRVDQRYCKGCNLCVWLCPPRALRLSDTLGPRGYYFPQLVGTCTGCGVCQAICPDLAIYLVSGNG